MLRRKLFAGLVSVVILFAIAGGFSLWVLRDHAWHFEKVVGEDFEAIRLANDFCLLTSSLNEHYLSPLITGGGGAVPDMTLYGDYQERFEENLEDLRALAKNAGREEVEAFTGLEKAARAFLAEFEKLFERDLVNEPVPPASASAILATSHEMASRAEEMLTLFERNVAAADARARGTARGSTSILAFTMIAAWIILVSIYIFLGRRILLPILDLTDSIEGVRQHNFGRVLPVRSRDEVGRLASAFNDMSAELRVLKRETDEELFRLNRESRAILSGFPHPVFILDEEGKLTRYNTASEELMKQLAVPQNLPPKIERRFRGCLEKNEDHLPDEIDEAMLFRLGEREIWYLPRIFRIHDEAEDSFHGWAIVMIDVTRVRWMDDMKSDLIGTVSHEIKTPLTSIRMVLHLLAEQKTGPLNERQESIVNSARNDCERLLESLENVLQLSRLESGASQIDRTPVPPSKLIDEAAQSFSGYFNESNVTLKKKVEDDLPRVLADTARIRQVFNNFLSNAVKFSPKGGEITLAATRRKTDFVRFSVFDQGKGIPESEQDRIFDRFYRSSSQANGEGTGLGLSICREIVRAHGGRIGVHSKPGEPTEFYFDLPTDMH